MAAWAIDLLHSTEAVVVADIAKAAALATDQEGVDAVVVVVVMIVA